MFPLGVNEITGNDVLKKIELLDNRCIDVLSFSSDRELDNMIKQCECFNVFL